MEITQLQVESELCMMLVDEVVHKEQVVREAAAAAIANAIECHPDYVEAVLQELLDVYDAKLYVRYYTLSLLFDDILINTMLGMNVFLVIRT